MWKGEVAPGGGTAEPQNLGTATGKDGLAVTGIRRNDVDMPKDSADQGSDRAREREERSSRQAKYLASLGVRADLDVLLSEQMWR